MESVSAKGVSLWANAGNFNDEGSQPGESIAATSEGTLSNSRVRSLFVRGVVMLLGFSVAGRSRSQEGRRRSRMKNVNDDFAFRVDRGGCWNGSYRYSRVAGRDFVAPWRRDDFLGFRIARSYT